MTTHDIAVSLRAQLAEVQADIARLEQATTQALPAKFADQASDLEQLAADEGREVQRINEAGQIVAALARIEAGTYGVCGNCGADIAPARLAALPTAANCINCAA